MIEWQVIDRLAAGLGVKQRTRDKWRHRGIPERWHLRLLEAAKRKRWRLTAAHLRRNYKSRERRTAPKVAA